MVVTDSRRGCSGGDRRGRAVTVWLISGFACG